jgi:hypothetical protein
MKRHLLGMISLFPVEESLVTPTPTVNAKGSLTLSFDKEYADQGDIVTASLNIKDVKDFAGYQVNIKYDPSVLQPVVPFGEIFLPYGNLTPVESGTLLANEKFKPVDVVFHDVGIGILSFGKSYLELDAYKKSGNIETTGSIGKVQTYFHSELTALLSMILMQTRLWIMILFNLIQYLHHPNQPLLLHLNLLQYLLLHQSLVTSV